MWRSFKFAPSLLYVTNTATAHDDTAGIAVCADMNTCLDINTQNTFRVRLRLSLQYTLNNVLLIKFCIMKKQNFFTQSFAHQAMLNTP